MSVCERLFDDEGVGRVVLEWVAKRRGFGCALRGVVVACRLNRLAELAVGCCEAGVGLLNAKAADFHAEVGFGETQTWEVRLVAASGRYKRM